VMVIEISDGTLENSDGLESGQDSEENNSEWQVINIPKEWILPRKVLTGLEVNANYRSNLFANSYSLRSEIIIRSRNSK
jgi:hypothetical protein